MVIKYDEINPTDESFENGYISNRVKMYSTKDDYVEFELPRKKKENIISYQRSMQNVNKL